VGSDAPQVGVSAVENDRVIAALPRKGWLARRPWPVRVLLLMPLYAGVLATIAISLQLIRYTIRFPDPLALTVNEPGPTLRILARDGSVIAERGELNDFVSLDRLPRHLVDAVIAVEDRRFYTHWGLDPSGLARAALANLRAGRTAQGGSTLTQQLAKNLFLSTDRTLSRKVEEMVLAIWLEVRLTKREILELYLNRVYFGGGAYGVEAAARRFFNKSARTVTVAEAAVIAGLLKAPSKYSPFANPGHARGRARVVIQAMESARVISPVSAAAALRQSVQFADPEAGKRPTGLEYAIDYVLDSLPPLASVGKRVIVVETTIDPDVQVRAQSTIAAAIAKDGAAAKVGQAAVVVIDTGGGIRALVGGRSFAESQFNRAVKARRQPGSAFKPFVYLAAAESGYWPDTPVVDAPIEIGQWSPRNEDGRFRGPITLTQALAHSVNTVAVRLQQEIGAEKVVNVARRLGVRSELRPDASLALGTSEMGLLELCGAFGTLAAGGLAVETHIVRRIRTMEGELLYERNEPRPRMLVAPDTIGAINTMLNATIVSGTGRRAAFSRHQAAGKTGTTQDYRDAWFVGYTAHLVAGVWFGNDDGSPMNRVAGGGLPALVWRDVMEPAHASLLPRSLPAIDGLVDPTRAPTPTERNRGPAMTAPHSPATVSTAGAVTPASASSPSPIPHGLEPVPQRRNVSAAKPSAVATDRSTSASPRFPSEPIDAELFARALDSPLESRTFDPQAVRAALGKATDSSSERRVGDGINGSR